MEHPKLSQRAAQVAGSMLAATHRSGEYQWLTVGDIAQRTGLTMMAVGQITARLAGWRWLESFREKGGGDRMYRFTPQGAEAARHVVDESPAAQPTLAVTTMAQLEATEPPAVVAAVRRALRWDNNNQPIKT